MPVKVVILTGPRPTYGFTPLPPLTNSAPESNIYRLVEATNKELEIHVISACSFTQVAKLQKYTTKGVYHWLTYPDKFEKWIVSTAFSNRWISALLNKTVHTHNLFTWNYLHRASQLIKIISPNLLLINSLPQYINYIKRKFPHTKTGLFVRGEMGSSRKYLPTLDSIITNSDGITNYVKKIIHNTQVPIYKIPNTLENNYCLYPKKYENGKKIIFTGRIEPVKGVLELLLAFSHVQKQLPDAKLTIVGGNFGINSLTDYEQLLVNKSRDLNLAVEFIGQVPNRNLPVLYQNADVAVFPSICTESFGMVALEAMRCGLPVIASRRPGFEELIVNGKTGIIVDDPENVEFLAEKILFMLEDNIIAERMGRAGFERSKQYVPEKAAEQFLKLINRCLIND